MNSFQLDLVVQQIQSEPVGLGGGGFFVLSKASAATVILNRMMLSTCNNQAIFVL